LLARLGYLLGESRYLEAAERTLEAAWSSMQSYPQAHLTLLAGLEDYLKPFANPHRAGKAAEVRAWAASLGAAYAPSRMIVAIPADAQDLPPAIEEKRAGADTVAYLCTGTSCSAPFTRLDEAEQALGVETRPI